MIHISDISSAMLQLCRMSWARPNADQQTQAASAVMQELCTDVPYTALSCEHEQELRTDVYCIKRLRGIARVPLNARDVCALLTCVQRLLLELQFAGLAS